jgi:hypothetical protein
MVKIFGPTYHFFFQEELHIGIPAQNEESKLIVKADKGVEVEIFPMVVEHGLAVIPVKIRNNVPGDFAHQINFSFEE